MALIPYENSAFADGGVGGEFKLPLPSACNWGQSYRAACRAVTLIPNFRTHGTAHPAQRRLPCVRTGGHSAPAAVVDAGAADRGRALQRVRETAGREPH